jgi:hypothetical protein
MLCPIFSHLAPLTWALLLARLRLTIRQGGCRCLNETGASMASKRRLRQKKCAGKRRFSSEAEARREADFMSRREGYYLAVYRCQFCGKWHYGHPPRNRRAALAQAITRFQRAETLSAIKKSSLKYQYVHQIRFSKSEVVR